MTALREKAIEAAFVRLAKAAGRLAIKLHGSPHQRQGLPDRLVLPPRNNDPKRGDARTVWVEFKRVGERPTELQLQTARELASRGEIVVFSDDARRAFALVVEESGLSHRLGEVVYGWVGEADYTEEFSR